MIKMVWVGLIVSVGLLVPAISVHAETSIAQFEVEPAVPQQPPTTSKVVPPTQVVDQSALPQVGSVNANALSIIGRGLLIILGAEVIRYGYRRKMH